MSTAALLYPGKGREIEKWTEERCEEVMVKSIGLAITTRAQEEDAKFFAASQKALEETGNNPITKKSFEEFCKEVKIGLGI
jgi:hypothetical protein